MPIVIPVELRTWGRQLMMIDMTGMGTGALLAMGIYHLAIFSFAVLGIVAAIKYLRS
jgi:hypothetical protein